MNWIPDFMMSTHQRRAGINELEDDKQGDKDFENITKKIYGRHSKNHKRKIRKSKRVF